MKRRDFMRLAGLTSATLALPQNFALAYAAQPPARWRMFEIIYEIDLLAEKGPSQLWLPMPQSAAGYQEAYSTDWSGNAARVGIEIDPDYGARILHAEWSADNAPRRLTVATRVATLERSVELGARSTMRGTLDPHAAIYLKPTPSMPTDGIVRDTAMEITKGIKDPLQKAHAIYEWVVDNTFREPTVLGCGTGDIKTMLETDNLGGKCADINSLFTGLTRSAGIPAREVYGIRVADSTQFKSLGKSGEISKAQHCRAEFYLEPYGWVPVDPADVRKVVLEEYLTLDDPKVKALRNRLFGYWEMNWVGFNSARDFDLQPSSGEPIPFFMYPNAKTENGRRNGLAPDKFAYKITAREITA